MNLQNKEVVVSGATGYLGQHVVSELVSQGARVRAIARIDSPASRPGLAAKIRRRLSIQVSWSAVLRISIGLLRQLTTACI